MVPPQVELFGRAIARQLQQALGINLADNCGANLVQLWYGYDGTGWDSNDDAELLPAVVTEQALAAALEAASALPPPVGAAERLLQADAERAIFLFDHLLPEPGPGSRADLFIPCVAGVVAHYDPENPWAVETFEAMCNWVGRCAYRRSYPQTYRAPGGRSVTREIDTSDPAWLMRKGGEFNNYRIGSIFQAARRHLGADWTAMLPQAMQGRTPRPPKGSRRLMAEEEVFAPLAPAPAAGPPPAVGPRPAAPRQAAPGAKRVRLAVPEDGCEPETEGLEVPVPETQGAETPAPGSSEPPPPPPPGPRRLVAEGDDDDDGGAPPPPPARERRTRGGRGSAEDNAVTSQEEIEASLLELFPGLCYNTLTRSIDYQDDECGPFEYKPVPLGTVASRLNRRFSPRIFPKERSSDTLQMLARDNEVNPVRTWLKKNVKKYSGTEILDGLGVRCFGPMARIEPMMQCPRLQRLRPMRDIVLERWLVSAVARAMIPGCSADVCMVLYSLQQDTGKTLFFSKLMPPFARRGEEGKRPWVSVPPPRPLDQQRPEMLQSAWIICLDEIDGLLGNPSHVPRIKAAITTRTDFADIKFQPQVETIARQSVFCGTTNRSDAMKDATGNRRFAVIDVTGSLDHQSLEGVKMVDLDYTHEHHEEIWAAATELFYEMRDEESWMYGRWGTKEMADYLEAFAPSSGLEAVVDDYVRCGYRRLINRGTKLVVSGMDRAREQMSYVPFYTVDDLMDYEGVTIDRRNGVLSARIHDAFLRHGLVEVLGEQQTFLLCGTPATKSKGFISPVAVAGTFAEIEALLRREDQRVSGRPGHGARLSRRL